MIGIFGGTFDPVHYGHLRPALEVLQDSQLQEIRWVPCRRPPHRGLPVADSGLRVAMLEAALNGLQGMRVDKREIERDGPSYMVDTLTSFRQENGDTPLCLLMGMDVFNSFDQWHKWQNILELAHLIVMQRPDSKEPEEGKLVEILSKHKLDNMNDMNSERAGKIIFLPVTQIDISASQIREAFYKGKNCRYLLPDSVIDIIEKERIYTN